MGNGVVEPERKNSATTAAAMVKQSTQTAFSTTNETYSKYSTTASATVEAANRYPGALSRALSRADEAAQRQQGRAGKPDGAEQRDRDAAERCCSGSCTPACS